jgi:hypothetical protein
MTDGPLELAIATTGGRELWKTLRVNCSRNPDYVAIGLDSAASTRSRSSAG